MSWETRRNQRHYYYFKRRRNGQVISEYKGAGSEATACLEAVVRRRSALERERSERQLMLALDAEVLEFTQVVKSLVGATLMAVGYHQHKREWRLQRDAADN